MHFALFSLQNTGEKKGKKGKMRRKRFRLPDFAVINIWHVSENEKLGLAPAAEPSCRTPEVPRNLGGGGGSQTRLSRT